MKKSYILLLTVVLLCLRVDTTLAQTEAKPGFQVAGKFSTTIKLEYLLYLPKDYDQNSTKKWPMILFLHGAGEKGDNVLFVKLWGPPAIVEERDLPFIVVSPLCPNDMPSWTSLMLPLKKLLDEITIKYNVDLSRIYLTGLSMGGYGTFLMMENYSQYFAAYAAITGGGNPMAVSRYAHVPGWLFSGDKDNVVPLYNSLVMLDSLKAHGADVKLTIHKGVGHWLAWDAAYNEVGLFEWFLTKQKNYKHFPY
jgi:predicted peptidase